MADVTETPVKQPVQCALPNCPRVFIPAHKLHKFCSSTCKRRTQNYKHVLHLGGR